MQRCGDFKIKGPSPRSLVSDLAAQRDEGFNYHIPQCQHCVVSVEMPVLSVRCNVYHDFMQVNHYKCNEDLQY